MEHILFEYFVFQDLSLNVRLYGCCKKASSFGIVTKKESLEVVPVCACMLVFLYEMLRIIRLLVLVYSRMLAYIQTLKLTQ